jgi:hypothetical protein
MYRSIMPRQGGPATEALTSASFIGGELDDAKLDGWAPFTTSLRPAARSTWTMPLVCFAPRFIERRTCSARSSTGGRRSTRSSEPDLNQYFSSNFNCWAYTCKVFTGNINPALAPELSLTFTFYAH